MTRQTALEGFGTDDEDFDPFADVEKQDVKLPNGPATLEEADRVFNNTRA